MKGEAEVGGGLGVGMLAGCEAKTISFLTRSLVQSELLITSDTEGGSSCPLATVLPDLVSMLKHLDEPASSCRLLDGMLCDQRQAHRNAPRHKVSREARGVTGCRESQKHARVCWDPRSQASNEAGYHGLWQQSMPWIVKEEVRPLGVF